MALHCSDSWSSLIRRYRAGREAVKQGADPALALSYVIDPPAKVLEASSGDLPSGYRWLTQDEERERDNERARRYNAPVSAKWKRAA